MGLRNRVENALDEYQTRYTKEIQAWKRREAKYRLDKKPKDEAER